MVHGRRTWFPTSAAYTDPVLSPTYERGRSLLHSWRSLVSYLGEFLDQVDVEGLAESVVGSDRWHRRLVGRLHVRRIDRFVVGEVEREPRDGLILRPLPPLYCGW